MINKLILLVVLLVLLSSCNTYQKTIETSILFTEELIEPTELDTEINEETSVSETDETGLATENNSGVKSPLNGKYYAEDVILQRPVVVMLDNHPSSRWQAGISKAEIIYECEVEYPYTRYMAVFLSEAPEQLGPVRSARPYFIKFALEYDPLYVHVGGSNEAFKNISEYNMADIDGLKSSAFWRYYDTGKTAPNNMYTSIKNIRAEQLKYGFRQSGNYIGFDFNINNEDTDISDTTTVDCNKLSIVYNKSYRINYVLDEEKSIYSRYVNDKLQIDEFYKTNIEAANIIIQKVQKKIVDDYGRLHLDIISEGTGYLISNGKINEITWSKISAESKTIYKDNIGNEIKLNPGQTWIQVISQNSRIEF